MPKNEIVPDAPKQRQMFIAREVKPVILRDEMEKLGLLARHLKPTELIGETFIIFKAKTFTSKFDTEFDPYFCHCTDLEHKEVWTVVLGGQAVVPILDAYINSKVNKPIQVTLGWEEGGSYGGYFTLE